MHLTLSLHLLHTIWVAPAVHIRQSFFVIHRECKEELAKLPNGVKSGVRWQKLDLTKKQAMRMESNFLRISIKYFRQKKIKKYAYSSTISTIS